MSVGPMGPLESQGLDLSPILHRAEPPAHIQRLCIPRGLMDDSGRSAGQRPGRTGRRLLKEDQPVTIDLEITNVQRTLGTRLSYEIASATEAGLPDDTIVIHAQAAPGRVFRFRRSGHQ
jgi:glutamate synthase domain-containing protein 3